ncbi:TetR/AcrR family transcriptional regulator [Litorihabitans aurantiacus]|uniref:HTH tetR-type domain-containing protein n=1 Tax=Litorihabitans aurantiacus TaxID=1930061 RepID=A0AA38CRT8_9MICO|nr:TetR/AcrR family transcriptional regulator [Litorihabitans aurantiacus]GMA33098.1 hypothetical protein GCM10025875_30900 [Litorihabitans aurantiacus]
MTRHRIVEMTVQIIAESGVDAVTFESVAERAGLTRGGIVYHYATRALLVEAARDHLARTVHDELVAALGVPGGDTDPHRAVRALLASIASPSSRPSLQMLISQFGPGAALGALREPLGLPAGRSAEELDDQDIRTSLALLAADGLLQYQATSTEPLDEETFGRLVAGIERSLGDDGSPAS